MTSDVPEHVRMLDPFGFFIGQSSAIVPLGGVERSLDTRYAFHTPYVEFQPGRVVFRLRFDRLRASFGELRVNVNAFIPGSGRDAIFVTSARVNLHDAAAVARGLTISFMSVAGATYAAYGYCTEGTDARAEGLTIEAEQLETADPATAQRPLLPSKFGAEGLQAPTRLIASEPPSFAYPVSQAITETQLQEPDFERWKGQLGDHVGTPEQSWTLAFAAQALRSYGLLEPGARGICWGPECRALAPVFADAGCSALLAEAAPISGDAGIDWHAFPCRRLDARADSPIELLPLADEAPDQRGFDFLLSLGAANQGYADGNTANMLLEMMSVLRPRGVAVHMLLLSGRTTATPGALPRGEVERLAVTLLSRGFSVAQLNFEGAEDGDRPFGLVLRKD